MQSNHVGYEFLRNQQGLSAFPCPLPARVGNVAKVTESENCLLVPSSVAPTSNEPLAHILFALKHEGVNLQILAQCLQRIEASSLAAAFNASSGSKYVRIVAFLWERFNNAVLEGLPAAVGPYVPLFDEKKYITGTVERNHRWRVDCNGLGSIGIDGFCPWIIKTPTLNKLLSQEILHNANEFAASIDKTVLDRTQNWSYLSETQSSFAIERQTATPAKAEAFIQLLKHASDAEPVTEEYLVQLQNLSITNPFQYNVQFRNRLNWLHNGGSGALGVTYVPPPPDILPSIMNGIMQMVNRPATQVNPLVLGSLVSFAFVFAHPFMDGNGRLSRFLFHKVVCAANHINGMVLPISMAMQRNEKDYLLALQSFSSEARKLWQVLMIDEGQFDFQFKGDASIYRYWNATPCIEFGLKMAEQALEIDLKSEARFLQKFDAAYQRIRREIDLNNNTLSLMIRLALLNEGKLFNNKRKMLEAKGVSESILNTVEIICSDICSN